ncbi:MAG: hypothetical protein ACFFDH_17315 [Promethearchaeota archaeon]
MREKKQNLPILGIGIMIIIISGVFIFICSFESFKQKEIMAEQKNIINENRKWVEKITFWEVTGGLGQDIIEGEKLYYEALAKYSAALQLQILLVFIIVLLSITIAIISGFLIFRLPKILSVRNT